MSENRNAKVPKKIYLYSSHDVTLAAFTRAQNITSFSVPPVGSAIIVEKYKDTQKIEYVKVSRFNNLSLE